MTTAKGTRIEFDICAPPRTLLDQRLAWAAERGWSLRLRPQDCAALARESAHYLRRGLSRHALTRIVRAVTYPVGLTAGELEHWTRSGALLTADEVRAIQLKETHVVRP